MEIILLLWVSLLDINQKITLRNVKPNCAQITCSEGRCPFCEGRKREADLPWAWGQASPGNAGWAENGKVRRNRPGKGHPTQRGRGPYSWGTEWGRWPAVAAEVHRGLYPKSSAKQRQHLGRGLPRWDLGCHRPHWLLGRGTRADRNWIGIRSSLIAAPSILWY